MTELNGSTGAVSKSYTYTPGGLRLSQTTHNSDGTTSTGYYSYDAHLDVTAVTDSTGNTKPTYGYTAYREFEFRLQITAMPRPPQTVPVPAWLKWVGAGFVAVGGAITSAGEACVAVQCELVLGSHDRSQPNGRR